MVLRPAAAHDAEMLWEWRNDPVTRANAIDGEVVAWEDHLDWLERVLDDPDRVLLVGVDDRGPFGTVRYDIEDGRAVASVTIAPDRRGEGLATWIIREGARSVEVPIIAYIKPTNTPSLRAFAAAGFEPRGEHEGFAVYAFEAR